MRYIYRLARENCFRNKFLGLILAVVLFTGFNSASGANNSLKLWYDKPAQDWMTEALPIENGRLGGMIWGGIEKEHIQFNEIRLWSGDETNSGSYQAFGDVYIDFKQGSDIEQYKRELNIGNAVHTTTYLSNGITSVPLKLGRY